MALVGSSQVMPIKRVLTAIVVMMRCQSPDDALDHTVWRCSTHPLSAIGRYTAVVSPPPPLPAAAPSPPSHPSPTPGLQTLRIPLPNHHHRCRRRRFHRLLLLLLRFRPRHPPPRSKSRSRALRVRNVNDFVTILSFAVANRNNKRYH